MTMRKDTTERRDFLRGYAPEKAECRAKFAPAPSLGRHLRRNFASNCFPDASAYPVLSDNDGNTSFFKDAPSMMKPVRTLAAAAVFAWSAALCAAPAEPLPPNPDAVKIAETLAQNWSLDAPKRQALELYLRDVMNIVVPHLKRTVDRIQAEGGAADDAISREVTKAIGELTAKGYPQLPAPYQRPRLRLNQMVLYRVPPEVCKRFYTEGNSALTGALMTEMEKTLYRDMDLSLYQELLNAQKAAIERAVYPAKFVARPTEEQLAQGQNAVARHLAHLLSVMKPEEKRRMVTALSEPEISTDRDGCDAAKLLYDAILGARGEAADWFILGFTQDLY
jgi:hypothetical protein